MEHGFPVSGQFPTPRLNSAIQRMRGRKLLYGNPNFDLDQLPTQDLSLGIS